MYRTPFYPLGEPPCFDVSAQINNTDRLRGSQRAPNGARIIPLHVYSSTNISLTAYKDVRRIHPASWFTTLALGWIVPVNFKILRFAVVTTFLCSDVSFVATIVHLEHKCVNFTSLADSQDIFRLSTLPRKNQYNQSINITLTSWVVHTQLKLHHTLSY
jgi:hypothetical protein